MFNRLLMILFFALANYTTSAFGANINKENAFINDNALAKTQQKNISQQKIAVVDVQTILDLSTAVIGIRASIEKISQDLQKEFSERESNLKLIEKKLIEKQETLSKENFEKEVLDFNKKVTEEQKILQEKKIRLEQAHSKAIGQVNEIAMKIIKDIAHKKQLNIVFPSTQLLYADESLNITEQVLLQLNQTLPSVEVKF